MSYYALWVTHDAATIFKFSATGVDEKKVEAASSASHHPGNPRDQKDKGYDAFYHKIAKDLTDAKEVMIMGPGVAKDEFRHHCEKHHHPNLAKAIVGTETFTSHPSKSEMLKKAKTFFKSYHQWTANY